MFDLYIPVFNNVFCVEYQLKTLNSFFQADNLNIIIIDNNIGRHPEASKKTKELCEKYGAIYAVNNDAISAQIQDLMESGSANAADQHGYTLTLIYNMLAKNRKPDYFGILDQDCFLFKPTNMKKYLDEKGAFGKVVPTHPNEKDHKTISGKYAWNLHVICNFFKYDFVKHLDLDFQPGKREKLGVALDTGGMNWQTLYKNLAMDDYIIPESHYYYFDDKSLLNKDTPGASKAHFEIVNNSFIHMVHSPGGSKPEDYLHPKVSYMKGFLDSCLINHKKFKNGPLNTGFYPQYDVNNLEKFQLKEFPEYELLLDHDSDILFQKYVKDKIFVETGTSSGRSVKQALMRGAKEVRTVEADKATYERNLEQFKNDSRVKQWFGRSEEKLKEMISDIEEPTVFWLDAHPSGPKSFGHEEDISGKKEFMQHAVLSAELEIISKHRRARHIIMIDDQNFVNPDRKFESDLYKKILLDSNPDYQFYFYQKPLSSGFSKGESVLIAFTDLP